MSTAIVHIGLPARRPVSLRQDAGVIGLVGLAHMISHFSQLLLAPLFPWLKEAFNASYTELGFLMTHVLRGVVRGAGGLGLPGGQVRPAPHPVWRAGPAGRGGLRLLRQHQLLDDGRSPSVAGVGNGVFHPVDYTLLNRKVSAPRLGHAYSVHGITGSLGWALAPAMVVPLAMAFSWRVALVGAGVLAFAVLAGAVA
jgi:FSR family fosmidomycin resistance protein-like MFS transporter